MRVIDLLNKIAKGEEVPKKIRFDGVDYFIVNEMYPYTYKDYNGNEIEDNFTRYIIHSLNDEIEILEEVEDKLIPEHISNEFIQSLDKEMIKHIAHKVNEIINYLQHISKEDK
jgi:tRNA U34 5-carboxymethylaminomethyl modifying enzyme MnmG/GidA